MITSEQALIPVESIANAILVLHGRKVILDADLARLYGVTTSRLNEQVRRNPERFPDDFMFQITRDEFQNLMSQNATSKSGWGGRRKLPLAFTEHGAVMAASVLNTPRAVEVSVYVVRAFVRLRELLSTHAEISAKLNELFARLDNHDAQIAALMEAIHALMTLPEPSSRPRGFRSDGSV